MYNVHVYVHVHVDTNVGQVHVHAHTCMYTCMYNHVQEDSGSKRSCRSQLYEFEYDHVFGSECCQEDVFSEISQLVQSALDGYNVCIFAYGQVSSTAVHDLLYTVCGTASMNKD